MIEEEQPRFGGVQKYPLGLHDARVRELISEPVDATRFFFPIVRVDRDGQGTGLAGTAFPITPGGGLMTCRHVVDIADDDGQVIPTAIVDGDRLVPIVKPVYLASPECMAYLPSALGREHPHYFPILPFTKVLPGLAVYSIGFYMTNGEIQRGISRAQSWPGGDSNQEAHFESL